MSEGGHFRVHHFKDNLNENIVHFHIISLKDSYLVWIGSTPCDFSSLAMAIPTKYDKMPLSTTILGSSSDTFSQNVAQKLSKKCNKQVFVSYNLPLDYLLLPLVEKRLFEEIKTNPDRF